VSVTSSEQHAEAEAGFSSPGPSDLKGRTVRGVAVTALSAGLEKCLALITVAVMARILTPRDYGLVGMVTAITAFIAVFSELGLSAATIQKVELTRGQVSTLFWVNIAFGALLTVVTVALAPVVAWFFQEPKLLRITMALGAGFLIGGAGVQHSALMSRDMKFGLLAAANLISLAVGSIAGIMAAAARLGPWALVVMSLSTSLAFVAAVWLLAGWVPGLPVRGSGVRPMLRFGGNLAAFNIVNYFARNLDKALLGRVWGADAVGFYTRGYNLMMLPIGTVAGPLGRVMIPALSRLQHDHARLGRAYGQAMELVALVTFPMMVGLAALAADVVPLVFGPQWGPVVPIFRVLCVTGIWQGIYSPIGWLFIASGRTDRLLRWGLFATPIICLGFWVGLPWGGVGVAAGYAAVMCALFYPSLRYSYKTVGLRVATIARDLPIPFCAALFMGAVVWLVRQALPADVGHVRALLVCVTVGVAVYLPVIALTRGREVLETARHLLRPESAPPATETTE